MDSSDINKILKTAEKHLVGVERKSEIDGVLQTSKQPRFNPEEVFGSIFQFVQSFSENPPEYKSDSRTRDKWIRQFWKLEPHLAGIVNQVCQMDGNKPWEMVGGRNQVARFTQVMHNFVSSPNTVGYRDGTMAASMSFHTADINAIIELGRDGAGGPLRGLFTVDPTCCQLTDDIDYPLTYYPNGGRGKPQPWAREDFIRIPSAQSLDENLNGLGFCSVSRAIALAQIMIASYMYDKEMLGARAPKGLMLISGISEEQWDTAMKRRKTNLDNYEREYYGGVAVLASSGLEQIDAKLVALSQLPQDFDRKTVTDLLMYGYALCFGYDPSEFWPTQTSTFGRGVETQIQHDKATVKGGMAFSLPFQEKLQGELPDTIHFEFLQRDQRGELVEMEIQNAKATLIKSMSEITGMDLETGIASGVLSRTELRQLLAEQQLIPDDWTVEEEDVTSTDNEEARKVIRQRLIEMPNIRRAVDEYADEPIIRYTWKPGSERTEIIWERGSDAIARHSFPVQKISRKVLYEDGNVSITDDDIQSAIDEANPELKELITAGVR